MSVTQSGTPPSSPLVRKLLRFGRFVIFLCTGGWAFPHVCTEDMDLTKIQNDHMARKS